METRYPIRAVAKLTGLSLDTLRAWERRYRAVVPERSDRGRQYSLADVERLRLLSQLVQTGHAIGGIASLATEQLESLLRQAPQPAAATELRAGFLEPILSAIEKFDATRAGDELSRLAAVLSPRDLVYQVGVPLMREVGIRWHEGSFGIAQEHLVSGLLRNLLGSMMRLYRPSSPAVKVVFATPAGESHEFGILASAMLASIAGIEPVYLGADLPAWEIANAAAQVSARAIALGITLGPETSLAEIAAIAAAMPKDAELWVGGAGSAGLDVSKLDRNVIVIGDLPALEEECRRSKS
jgi:DNA-binding transcriptional MerR regulator/methylmalonyl-CoA mutase cobalamin-binding subunit